MPEAPASPCPWSLPPALPPTRYPQSPTLCPIAGPKPPDGCRALPSPPVAPHPTGGTAGHLGTQRGRKTEGRRPTPGTPCHGCPYLGRGLRAPPWQLVASAPHGARSPEPSRAGAPRGLARINPSLPAGLDAAPLGCARARRAPRKVRQGRRQTRSRSAPAPQRPPALPSRGCPGRGGCREIRGALSPCTSPPHPPSLPHLRIQQSEWGGLP